MSIIPITAWARDHHTELALFTLAAGIRLAYAVFIQVHFGEQAFAAYGDAFSFYLRGADNLVHHGVISLNEFAPFTPTAYRTPLYILFIAIFRALHWPLLVPIILQNLMAGAISVFIYRLGRHIFSARVGWWAAVLTALEPMSIYWNNLLMSDYLYAFLFLMALCLFFQRRYYWFAIMFGLATLTRPVGVYLFPVFLLALGLTLRRAKAERLWRTVAITTVIFLAVLFPWALRNKILFNTWQLSSASWYNLYKVVTADFVHGQGQELPLPSVPPDYPYPPAFEEDFISVPFYQAHWWQIVAKQPTAYAVFYVRRGVELLFKNQYHYLIHYVIQVKMPELLVAVGPIAISILLYSSELFFIVVYVLAALSLRDEKRWPATALFLILFFINHFTLGLLVDTGADGSRYRLPFLPLLFLCALWSLQRARKTITAWGSAARDVQ